MRGSRAAGYILDGGNGIISTTECRAVLQALYAVHNPRKLTEIDAILEEWSGQQAELVAALRKKYPSAFALQQLKPDAELGDWESWS